MKCLTCNECSDKDVCAKYNGLDKAPFPLVEYKKKLCVTNPGLLKSARGNIDNIALIQTFKVKKTMYCLKCNKQLGNNDICAMAGRSSLLCKVCHNPIMYYRDVVEN